MKQLYILILLLFCYTESHSQYVFKQDELPVKISILKYAELADANYQDYSIEQVKSNSANLKFRWLNGNLGKLGFTDHTYWLKFELLNTLNIPVFYYLEAAESITDNVNLYLIDSRGNVLTQHNGDKLSFNQRAVDHRKTLFKIKLNPGERKQAFIEIKNDGERNSLPLNLISQESLLQSTYHDQFIMGIFYGVLLIIAVTYLFFYFAISELSFLYYSLYVAFVALCQFALDGFFHQYLDRSNSWINLHAVIIFAVVSSYFFGKYSEIILDVKNSNKLLRYSFKLLYIFFGIVLSGIIFIPAFLKFSYPVVNILTLTGMILIVISIGHLVFKKKPVDLYYASGISILFICFTLVIAINFGWINNASIDNITKLGIGLEIIALSLSMANRIRLLKTKKEELQAIALQKSEEMNDMKSYFLSNMSHELRTPLNAILGMTIMIESEIDDPKIKANCGIIKQASNSLISSVNDILDFSQIERGDLKLDRIKFRPHSIIQKVNEKFKTQALSNGIDFNFSSALAENASVIGDPLRLEQILNNILSNALKFTPQGIVRFSVETQNHEDNEISLNFIISDTGIGIAPEKLDSVFEMFSQININNKRKFGGFGIGLCVVKALVDLHEGKIELESKPNEGTVCCISLDYVLAPEEKKPVNLFPVDECDLSDKHILVVEDNQMNQMVIKMILKKWKNTRVSFANDGLESLEILRTTDIDIVLMDLQMPVMDGYEATEAIRNGTAGESNRQIPIIVLTADVLESTKDRVFELGVNDYMTKPLDAKLLYQKVTSLLSKIENVLT
ncbi:hybrid sensor histidine kinase/response regulator [Daejeonella oryzae]|uniref:hybrid sensor histidine kinase/response regulator n=1 Tax=Daejeonella oryzae TaxID=1122943 RepID=UPI0003F6FE8C|nr:hybrid sensor histidine kinase/response regulator [Daejeonella oryzae]